MIQMIICVIFIMISNSRCEEHIYILAMEQLDRFGLRSLPAIYIGTETVNALYKNVFDIHLMQTTFGETCSPNGKAAAFSLVHRDYNMQGTMGPGKFLCTIYSISGKMYLGNI